MIYLYQNLRTVCYRFNKVMIIYITYYYDHIRILSLSSMSSTLLFSAIKCWVCDGKSTLKECHNQHGAMLECPNPDDVSIILYSYISIYEMIVESLIANLQGFGEPQIFAQLQQQRSPTLHI